MSSIEACLASVFEHTRDVPFEVIVVDNASSDSTPRFLDAVAGVRIILNPTNRGFAAANNQALAVAAGDTIVLLNPDTVVTHGWLSRLLSHLDGSSDVAAVGPVSNRASEIQADFNARGAYASLDEMQRYAASVATTNAGRAIDFHRLSGFCLVVRADVARKIGGLDEDFGVGFYEDDDFSRRILEAGYRLQVALDVFVHHEGGVSFSQTFDGMVQKQMLLNRQLFLSKWARPSDYEGSRGGGESFRAAVSSSPDIAQTHIDRADWLLAAGPDKTNVLRAKQSLELALVADAGDRAGYVYRRLASCYARLGLPKSAKACRRHEALLSPSLPKRLSTAWRSGGFAEVARRAIRTFGELSKRGRNL